MKNYNHHKGFESEISPWKKDQETQILLFSPLLPLIHSFSFFSFLSCALSPPALITLVWLTSRGHSLGSFQHTDPVDLSFRWMMILWCEERDDGIDDNGDDDGQVEKESSWTIWSTGGADKTTEWSGGVEWGFLSWSFSHRKYNFFTKRFSNDIISCPKV